MKVAFETFRSQKRTVITQLIWIHLVINGIALLLRLMAFPDHYLFWFGPALLLIYVAWSWFTSTARTPLSPA